ncbi:uncharacterized protein LOC116937251 [Petromyzon marinus]|uniref:uncharacterized protein LOC116937251 n=1 Tax=Petromyzon marinus TaxID=7757 RepID=UPI003F6FF33F
MEEEEVDKEVVVDKEVDKVVEVDEVVEEVDEVVDEEVDEVEEEVVDEVVDEVVPLLAVALTRDHKPEDPVERERIERLGGRVMRKPGGPCCVAWRRPLVAHCGPGQQSSATEDIPFLAVSRSLGDLWSYDFASAQFVVSPEPDVSAYRLDPGHHRYLVLATDGVWDVLTPTEAVALCHRADAQQQQRARASGGGAGGCAAGGAGGCAGGGAGGCAGGAAGGCAAGGSGGCAGGAAGGCAGGCAAGGAGCCAGGASSSSSSNSSSSSGVDLTLAQALVAEALSRWHRLGTKADNVSAVVARLCPSAASPAPRLGADGAAGAELVAGGGGMVAGGGGGGAVRASALARSGTEVLRGPGTEELPSNNSSSSNNNSSSSGNSSSGKFTPLLADLGCSQEEIPSKRSRRSGPHEGTASD